MHSHVEHLNEAAVTAIIRVFPNALNEMIEGENGELEVGEATALMSVNVTTDVLGRDGINTTLTAFSVPVKMLRDSPISPTELDDLEALALSLAALVPRLRSAINMMAAIQE